LYDNKLCGTVPSSLSHVRDVNAGTLLPC